MYESLAPISFFLTNWKFLDLKKVSKKFWFVFQGSWCDAWGGRGLATMGPRLLGGRTLVFNEWSHFMLMEFCAVDHLLVDGNRLIKAICHLRPRSHLAFFLICQRLFYIIFLWSRAFLEKVTAAFLNVSPSVFFLPYGGLKKVQLSGRKRPTSGVFWATDQSQAEHW
jgi:hypothetical protein